MVASFFRERAWLVDFSKLSADRRHLRQQILDGAMIALYRLIHEANDESLIFGQFPFAAVYGGDDLFQQGSLQDSRRAPSASRPSSWVSRAPFLKLSVTGRLAVPADSLRSWRCP